MASWRDAQTFLTLPPPARITGSPLTLTLTDGSCTPDPGESACGFPPGLTFTAGALGGTLSGTLAADLRTATAAHYSMIWTATDDGGTDSLSFEIAIVDERPLLENLYTHTNGDQWTNNTNWAADIPASTCLTGLHGITLKEQRTGIGAGPIPTIISSLMPDLISLNLSRNELTGTIPSELTSLYRLGTLDLSHNLLTGEIPSGLNSLSAIPSKWTDGTPCPCLFPTPFTPCVCPVRWAAVTAPSRPKWTGCGCRTTPGGFSPFWSRRRPTLLPAAMRCSIASLPPPTTPTGTTRPSRWRWAGCRRRSPRAAPARWK